MDHLTPIQKLLQIRGMNGRELAIKLDTTEAQVSKWRRGLAVGEQRQKVIAKKLKLTDEELAAMGWLETVNG